jgi:sec-independent protein translocase protein TatB
MLPEIGATELMVIAAVALIVVGPKDLPVLLRKLGQFVAKLRGMANDFRSSFDEMARQSELDDLRKEVAAMRAGNLPTSLNPIDDGHVSKVFDDIQADLHGHPPLYDPAITQDYDSPDAVSEPEAAAKPKRVRKPKTTVEILPEPEPAPAPKPRAKAPLKAAATKVAAPKAPAAKTRKTKA